MRRSLTPGKCATELVSAAIPAVVPPFAKATSIHMRAVWGGELCGEDLDLIESAVLIDIGFSAQDQ